jgi:hypothetical protein
MSLPRPQTLSTCICKQQPEFEVILLQGDREFANEQGKGTDNSKSVLEN